MRVEGRTISPSEALNALLVSRGTSPISTGVRAADLIRRPQLSYEDVMSFDEEAPDLPRAVREEVGIEIKYAGYIQKQLAQVAEMRKLEAEGQLPAGTDYSTLAGLSLEAREKLQKIRPLNIGQASRISGVSPADVSVLLVWMQQKEGRHDSDK